MISLFIGLGNIGPQYEGTRHNIGFEVLDRLAAKLTEGARTPSVFESELSRWVEVSRDSGPVVLAWPGTYMNRSGLAATIFLERMDLAPSQMLVIVDDYNLPLGKIRLRRSGSDGGHNGLESIIRELGTQNFPRLRLGIGPVPDNVTTVDFVLARFRAEEAKPLKEMLDTAAEAALLVANNRFEEAMTRFNPDPA